MAGFTNIPKLQVEDLGTEGTGDRIALFNSDGELVGYMMATDGCIPLSGTEVGSPVTGSIQVDGESFSLYGTDEVGTFYGKGLLRFQFPAVQLMATGISGLSIDDDIFYLFVGSSQLSFNGINGLSATEFYAKDNDSNYAQMGDIATTNETVTHLSLSDLNTAYGTQGTGFKVICPAINLIYIKSSLTTWEQFTTTAVV